MRKAEKKEDEKVEKKEGEKDWKAEVGIRKAE